MKELIEEIKIYHSIEEIEKMINSITNSYLELNGENEFDEEKLGGLIYDSLNLLLDSYK